MHAWIKVIEKEDKFCISVFPFAYLNVVNGWYCNLSTPLVPHRADECIHLFYSGQVGVK